MHIFLIKRTDGHTGHYDKSIAHVIVANNVDEVVCLAKEGKNESDDIWDNAIVERVGEYIGLSTSPFILLTDFNAA